MMEVVVGEWDGVGQGKRLMEVVEGYRRRVGGAG